MTFSSKLKKIIKTIIFYHIWKPTLTKIITFFDKKRRVTGNHKYTVISAVYNVEKYLEEYFESFVQQTLKFEEHIHIIMIDDGSPDKSAEIIKKWQQKYPDNITYIKKENGGQASARNFGMNYMDQGWVTFIDPDDFIHYKYFEVIDKFLTHNKKRNIGLISCNYIFYYEDTKQIKNSHPLKSRFKTKEKIVSPSDMEGYIQLSVNSVFFNIDLLQNRHIKFHENIRPNFEDGHFINRYLLENNKIEVAFLKDAKYYYRKRSDGTSTLDTSWETAGKYIDVLNNGYLNLFETSQKKYGQIPSYIQRTILYDLTFHFRRIVNKPEKIDFLTESQKDRYKSLLYQLFKYIDIKTILDFNLAKCRFYHKVGFLSLYKNINPPYQIIYIHEYNLQESTVSLRYYYHESTSPTIKIDDNIVKPEKQNISTYIHHFINEPFVHEINILLNIPPNSQVLYVDFQRLETKLSFKGKQYDDGFFLKTSIP